MGTKAEDGDHQVEKLQANPRQGQPNAVEPGPGQQLDDEAGSIVVPKYHPSPGLSAKPRPVLSGWRLALGPGNHVILIKGCYYLEVKTPVPSSWLSRGGIV